MKRGVTTIVFLFLSLFSFLSGQSDAFTDPRDGQTYATFTLNGMEWFAENLRFETSGSFYYNSSGYGEQYGRLYTLYEAGSACPEGWRLPSDRDWKDLLVTAGGYHDMETGELVGDRKRGFQSLMMNGNGAFSARLGGGVFGQDFTGINTQGYFWAARLVSDRPVYYSLESGRETVQRRTGGAPGNAFSCRCVRPAASVQFYDQPVKVNTTVSGAGRPLGGSPF